MKESTLMRIKSADGASRVIDNTGCVLASSNRAENLKQVRSITFGNQEQAEPLTYQVNETPADDSELLLPTGFKMLANGEILTPEDRQKKVEVKDQKSESQSDSELMLPAGMKLEN